MSKLLASKNKTLSGFMWTFSDLIMNQGIQFIIQIILARLLLPSDFGLIGMITIFIFISNSIIDSGFANALIREKKVTQKDYSTVFYFNLITSIIIYIILFILSPYISKFYNEIKIISILRVLGLTVIINSFGLVQRVILTKKIDFKTQTKINVMASIISGIMGIIMAIIGFGVWSLVARTLFQSIIQSLLLCMLNKWIPSLEFDFSSFKKYFKFGWKLLVSGLINTIYNNIYYLIIGKGFSAYELGYYTNASKVKDISTQSINTAIQKVTYPVLSNISDDEKLKMSYIKLLKISAFIIFPIVMGLSAISDPLFNIVFGEKWAPSIILFQILCFEGMLYPIHSINLNILQVKGRSDLFLKLEIIKKIVYTIIIASVLFLKLGIIHLLLGAVLNSYIAYFINTYYTKDLINYSIKEQIKDIMPSLISSLVMWFLLRLVSNSLQTNNFIKIIIQILIGIVLYISINIIFRNEELLFLKKKIMIFLKKNRNEGVFYG